MVVLTVTNGPDGNLYIQDKDYANEGPLVIELEPGETGVYYMLIQQYERIKGELDAWVTAGNITYTALDGPASFIYNDSDVPGQTVKDALDYIINSGLLERVLITRDGGLVYNSDGHILFRRSP